MAKCAFCGADTPLHECGVPICLKCDKEREPKRTAAEVAKKESKPPTQPTRSFGPFSC